MLSSAAGRAALLSTGFISLIPNLMLFLFPNYAANPDSTTMIFGQTLAAGGLLGDVFLHTLPHTMGEPKAEGEALTTGLWILLGFVLFLSSDLLMSAMQGSSHGDKSTSKQSMALLNLAADALHNFTDGLAIGASYATQGHQMEKDMTVASLLASRGGLASMSILFHEVPHELGDFCTLIRAGYSKTQAVAAQFVTATAAFLGTIVAWNMSESMAGDQLIFFAAGSFLYLATVTILADALEEKASPIFRLLQLLSFCAGIGFMWIVAILEESEKYHAHAHEHSHHDHHHSHESHDHEL